MVVRVETHESSVLLLLSGEVRWNDRLRLSAVAPALAASRAREVAVDARACVEHDRGSLSGILATAERMARSGGRAFRRIAA
jgi:hypothetical protein